MNCCAITIISTTQWILFGSFMLAFFIQLFYYLFYYLKLVHSNNSIPQNSKDIPPVSIIIAARNDSKYLENALPVLLHQNYPEYEIIIADDRSDDGTRLLIERFQKTYNNLRYVRIDEGESNTPGKKHALSKAIKTSSFQCLLFTDADCIPVSDMWIQRMIERKPNFLGIVLGYGSYLRENGLLNAMIRYDTAFIAMQYGGFALRGLAYMGVGRNLMYSKDIWEKNGFESHMHILSGDDDLFVSEHASNVEVNVQFHYDAITRSYPEQSFLNWQRQKTRHYSTASSYSLKNSFLLALEPLSRVALYLLFLALLFTSSNALLWSVLSVFVLREAIVLYVLGRMYSNVEEKGLWAYIPIFDFVMPWLQTYFYLCGLIKYRNNIWK